MQCTAAAARVQAGSASPFLAGTSLRQAAPRSHQQQQTRASRQLGGGVACTMAPAEPAKLQRPDSTGR